ncbi:MAG TPA: hypothetical protein VIV59_01670, partial [Anaeromyxobacteraceae bacterium]
MFAWLERLGLKRSIYLTFSISVLAVTVVTLVLLSRFVRESLESALRRRGESQVRVLALELDLAVAAADGGMAQEQLDHAFDPDDGAYAIALAADGSVLARRLAPALATQADAIVADHVQRGHPAFHQADGLFSFSAAVRHLEESKGGKGPPPGEARRPQGHVLLGLSTAGLDRQLNQVRLAMTLTLAGAVVFFAGLGWALS